jgi:hypothetical protein
VNKRQPDAFGEKMDVVVDPFRCLLRIAGMEGTDQPNDFRR